MAGISRRYSKLFGALGSTTALFLALGVALPRPASATMSVGAWMLSSPNDLTGFTTLSGNDALATATMPFTLTIDGTGYTTVAISTNGWLEFGGNTCVSGCGTANSDPVNTTLPTSKHTNPFLAAFWDDLQTFSNAIRYGTVGTSPNRIFIVDYDGYDVDPATEQGSADDGHLQIEIHEGSNLINVRYHDTGSNLASGITATIGWQGAGGSGASAQPISANARILDDNRPNEGWSVDVGRSGLTTLAATIEESPDDISGFTQLTGNDSTATVALPFSVSLEGTSYSGLVISTNGWVELGSNTAGNSDPATAACRFRTTHEPPHRRLLGRHADAGQRDPLRHDRHEPEPRLRRRLGDGRRRAGRRGRHQRADADPRDVEPDPCPLSRRRQLERERPGGDDRLPGRGRVERRRVSDHLQRQGDGRQPVGRELVRAPEGRRRDVAPLDHGAQPGRHHRLHVALRRRQHRHRDDPVQRPDRRRQLHDGRHLDERLARARRQHAGHERPEQLGPADRGPHESLPGRVLGQPRPEGSLVRYGTVGRARTARSSSTKRRSSRRAPTRRRTPSSGRSRSTRRRTPSA
jgi:hypothetical protein